MNITLAVSAVGLLAAVAMAAPMETHVFPGTHAVYSPASDPRNTTLNASFTGVGYEPAALRIELTASPVADGSLATEVIVTCTPPWGDPFDVQMYGVVGATDGTRLVPISRANNPVGAWTFVVYDALQNGDGSGPEANVSGMSVALESAEPPSFATNYSDIPPGLSTHAEFLGGLSWFVFNLPSALNDLAQPRYLDISTSGPVDTVMGLYDNTGLFRGSDDDSGVGTNAFLSYGYGGGSTTGDVNTFSDGRTGKLPADLYWLAIGGTAEGNLPVFNRGFQVTPVPGGDTGSFTLKFDYGTTTPGGTPPAATDLGTLSPGPGGAEALVTSSITATAGQITWLKFFAIPITRAAGTYLDISTSNVIPDDPESGFDPEIGLYSVGGFPVGLDDDDGLDTAAFLSFGGGGGTATGDTFSGPEFFTTRSDGRDGELAAGNYYLAVAPWDAAFHQAFVVTTNNPQAATLDVEFRTGAVTTQCSLADIGVQGGMPGHDHLLDNNDFVVYITYFFASDPVADIGVQGGTPGHDGLFNNNDFIVFISIFFTDQPNCDGNP